MEGAAETVSLFWVGGSFSLARRQVRGGGGVQDAGFTRWGWIGRQPAALPQRCCSALKWAPVPRIYCDLLVLTNRVRIADKAVALYSPGLRGGPRRLGPSCVAVMDCSDIFYNPCSADVLSVVSAMCFPVWMLLTAQMVPLAFVAVEWA